MSENQQRNVIEEYQPERVPELEAEGILLSSCLKCKRLGYDLRSRERHVVDEYGFFKIRYLHPKGEIVQRDSHTNEIINKIQVQEEIHEVGTAIGLDMSFKAPASFKTPAPTQEQKQIETKIPSAVLEPESTTIPNLIKKILVDSEKLIAEQEIIQSNLRLLATKWEESEYDKQKKLNPRLGKTPKLLGNKQFRRGVRSPRDVVKCPNHGLDSYEYKFQNKGVNQEGFYYVHKEHSPNDRCYVTEPNAKPLSPKTLELYRGRKSRAEVDASNEKVKQLLQEYDMIKYLHKQERYPKIVKCSRCKRKSNWAVTSHTSREKMIKYILKNGRLPSLSMDFIHIEGPKDEHTQALIGSVDDALAALPK